MGLENSRVSGLEVTFWIYNEVLIATTSFMGAYFFWRGISLYAGGFPNEFELIK